MINYLLKNAGKLSLKKEYRWYTVRLKEYHMIGKLLVEKSTIGKLLVKKKEGRSVLFNDALNTFYLRLYGVGHMVKDHSDSERGNPLLPHGLLFLISSKGSFICIIPQTG